MHTVHSRFPQRKPELQTYEHMTMPILFHADNIVLWTYQDIICERVALLHHGSTSSCHRASILSKRHSFISAYRNIIAAHRRIINARNRFSPQGWDTVLAEQQAWHRAMCEVFEHMAINKQVQTNLPKGHDCRHSIHSYANCPARFSYEVQGCSEAIKKPWLPSPWCV